MKCRDAVIGFGGACGDAHLFQCTGPIQRQQRGERPLSIPKGKYIIADGPHKPCSYLLQPIETEVRHGTVYSWVVRGVGHT